MARFVLLLIILFIAFMVAVTLVTGTLRRIFGGGHTNAAKPLSKVKGDHEQTVPPTQATGEVIFTDAAVTVLRGEANVPKQP
jgi:ABC-type cobalt transport system substrate-binding protein